MGRGIPQRGNGSPWAVPAAPSVEEGGHVSRWDLQVPLVFPNSVFRSRILRKDLDLNYDILFKNK